MYNICIKISRGFGSLITHPFSLVFFQMFSMIIFRDKFGCHSQHAEIVK